jgi:hypothetical protein
LLFEFNFVNYRAWASVSYILGVGGESPFSSLSRNFELYLFKCREIPVDCFVILFFFTAGLLGCVGGSKSSLEAGSGGNCTGFSVFYFFKTVGELFFGGTSVIF